jgi:hypothetical protein
MHDLTYMAKDIADYAKKQAISAGLGPQEATAALLTAGLATAFASATGGDLRELKNNLIGFVNNCCTNIIEGVEADEKAVSNG